MLDLLLLLGQGISTLGLLCGGVLCLAYAGCADECRDQRELTGGME